MSSAVYGEKSESALATTSAASRTAGSVGPAEPSMALRSALTNSITLATPTLNLKFSISGPKSRRNEWVALRRVASPFAKSTPTSLRTSLAVLQARAKNFAEPDGETSAQSMSSSGGPAKAMVKRMASTPCSSSWSLSATRLPRDFDMAEPFINTMPWLSNLVNGSSKSIIPMSCRALVKKRA